MAIFHFSAKVIGRSSGHSSVAAAAYRAGEKLRDERTGTTHDYTPKQRVDHAEILAPENAPAFVLNRSALWNEIERVETRKDAQLAREIEFALPRELSPQHQKRMAREFVQRQFVDRGMVADLAFHNLEKANPHCHVLLTMRQVTPAGFGGKERAWNSPALLTQWRSEWAGHANRELARAKKDTRIDARTLVAQREEAVKNRDRLLAIQLDRPAQIHVGHTGNPERAERNEGIKEIAIASVTLNVLKEQKRVEGLSENAWDKFRKWTDEAATRDASVAEWKRVNPRLFSFWNKLGMLPGKLKKLVEQRDKATALAGEWTRATASIDVQKKRVRDLANVLETRAAERLIIPAKPRPQEPAPAPSAMPPAPKPHETPEEARKRGWKR